ncbi:MAG: carbon-nitrogen hydrolase family protein [Planctomycetota bacterium]
MLRAEDAAAKSANLVPAPDSGAWKEWAPREALAPESGKKTLDGKTRLWMRSPDRFQTFGKWIAQAGPVEGGQWYLFRASYKAEKVDYERTSVVAFVRWTQEGRRSLGQYIQYLVEEEGGWKSLTESIRAPEDATGVQVELFLRWTEQGEVYFRSVELLPQGARAPRKIKAAAVFDCTVYNSTRETLIERTEAAIDQAAREKPDIIVLTENFTDRGREKPVAETAESVPDGPGCRFLSQKARQHHCYISASLHEKDGPYYYNSAVLFDRKGEFVGKYRKVQLALGEAQGGISPGRDYPVFQTDFGKVGMLICWDNSFQESARILALRGAEMILLSIAGDGVPGHWETVCRARAMENSLYLVGSLSLRGPSLIVGPDGTILAQTNAGPIRPTPPLGVVVAECDLDFRPMTRSLSVGAMGDHRSCYLVERRTDTLEPLIRPQTILQIPTETRAP